MSDPYDGPDLKTDAKCEVDEKKPESTLAGSPRGAAREGPVPRDGVLEGDALNAGACARDIIAGVVDEVVRRSRMASTDDAHSTSSGNASSRDGMSEAHLSPFRRRMRAFFGNDSNNSSLNDSFASLLEKDQDPDLDDYHLADENEEDRVLNADPKIDMRKVSSLESLGSLKELPTGAKVILDMLSCKVAESDTIENMTPKGRDMENDTIFISEVPTDKQFPQAPNYTLLSHVEVSTNFERRNTMMEEMKNVLEKMNSKAAEKDMDLEMKVVDSQKHNNVAMKGEGVNMVNMDIEGSTDIETSSNAEKYTADARGDTTDVGEDAVDVKNADDMNDSEYITRIQTENILVLKKITEDIEEIVGAVVMLSEAATADKKNSTGEGKDTAEDTTNAEQDIKDEMKATPTPVARKVDVNDLENKAHTQSEKTLGSKEQTEDTIGGAVVMLTVAATADKKDSPGENNYTTNVKEDTSDTTKDISDSKQEVICVQNAKMNMKEDASDSKEETTNAEQDVKVEREATKIDNANVNAKDSENTTRLQTETIPAMKIFTGPATATAAAKAPEITAVLPRSTSPGARKGSLLPPLVAELARESPSAERLRVTIAKEFSNGSHPMAGQEYDLFWSTVGLLRRYEDPMRPSGSRGQAAQQAGEDGQAKVEDAEEDEEVAAAIDAIDALFPGAQLESGENDDEEEDLDETPHRHIQLQRDDEDENQEKDALASTLRKVVSDNVLPTADKPTNFLTSTTPYLPQPNHEKDKSFKKRLRRFFSTTFGSKKSKQKPFDPSDGFQPTHSRSLHTNCTDTLNSENSDKPQN